MEFDLNRMYTVLNANEAKIGSKGYYADTLKELKEMVSDEINDKYGTLTKIADEGSLYRFRFNGITNMAYAFFYLVEEPKIEDSKIEKKPLSLNEIAKLSYKKRKAINSHVLNKKTKFKKRLAFDLADIICSCASIAEREHIDLDKTVADYLEEIEEK